MRETLLPTNVFHLFGGPCTHVNTIEEFVQKQDSFTVRLRACMAFLYNLDNSVVVHSSNLGIVRFFSGATFDVEHRSSQDVLMSVERM